MIVRFASIAALAVVLLIFGPLITIWSLNTVFALGIEYTIWSWLGTAWLSMILTSTKVRGK